MKYFLQCLMVLLLSTTLVYGQGTPGNATQVSGITAIGTISDTAYTGSGTTSVISVLKGLYQKLGTTLSFSTTSLPLPSGAAQEAGGNLASIATANGSDITSATQLPGGSGIRGWLSGIYTKLSGTLSVSGTFWQPTQPVSVATLPLPTGAALETGGNLSTITTQNTTLVSGVGTPADSTYTGTGSSSIISAIKGVYSNITGVQTQLQSMTGGSSSSTPLYTALVCNGVVVSASAPCSFAITSPSTSPFSLSSGTTAVGYVNASNYGYREANIDITVTSGSVTLTPVVSESGQPGTWHSVSPGCFRGIFGIQISTVGNYSGAFQCAVSETYFEWQLSGLSTGAVITGYTSFRTNCVATCVVLSVDTFSSSGGCPHWWHLSGNTTAGVNALSVASGGNQQFCGLDIENYTTSDFYWRTYDFNGTPNCAHGTWPTSSGGNGQVLDSSYRIPAGTRFSWALARGAYVNSGLAACGTGADGDTDTTAAPAGVKINVNY